MPEPSRGNYSNPASINYEFQSFGQIAVSPQLSFTHPYNGTGTASCTELLVRGDDTVIAWSQGFNKCLLFL